jgi:alkylation response protein AidB-like acyl-CoA dehydrogenase
MVSAEAHPPYVQHFNTFGRRIDNLITSEGWRGLQDFGIKKGMVAQPYENDQREYSRVLWAARYVLWAGSACWVNCPTLMVDGVAALLRRHLTVDTSEMSAKQRVVLRSAYERLVSRDTEKAWTTGQWMTERQGGSDVSMTETLATWDPEGAERFKAEGRVASDGLELGPWRLDGFKWFSSATDAHMVVMLARTPKGVSLFFAPMRRTLSGKSSETELNGVRIQRLKNKVGTRALPTAELELTGMRGWLIGEEGRGTKEIATVLNIARVHNGLTAIGLWGRGLSVVRAFVKVRIVGRRPLWERTAYLRTLSRMHVEYRANVLFNFFVAGLLGCVEQKQVAEFEGKAHDANLKSTGQLPGVKDAEMAEWLLRLLTPALKGHCSKTAIAGLQECMESLGGVGYLENDDPQFNIARLWRDSAVLPIWEGTTDMMADDTIIRCFAGKTKEPVMAALTNWVELAMAKTKAFDKASNTVWGWWIELAELLRAGSKAQLESESRTIMTRLVDVVQGILLMIDAARDGDEVAVLAMNAWFEEKNVSAFLQSGTLSLKEQSERDLKIVLGADGPGAEQAKL